MKIIAALALLLATASAAQIPPPTERTTVTDPAALARLQRNSGVTLQWISFESPARGHVRVTREGELYRLRGEQSARRGSGRLTLDGTLTEISAQSFLFLGRIIVTDAPDAGRACVRDGEFEFRVTQNRRYWRLQQMTVCDGLTDYIDIYF